MKTMLAVLALLLSQEPMPTDAQKIITQADAKLEALRKSYEESCARIRMQEAKDLQRIYDATVKGTPGAAATIKVKIDALATEVSVGLKPPTTVDQWLQGKWICMFQGSGDVVEFKGTEVFSSEKGKYLVKTSDVQIIWDSGYVVTMRIPKDFGDETTGQGRSGQLLFKRLKLK